MTSHIIFGIGNPDEEYGNSRHNAGKQCVDFFAQKLGLGWRSHSSLPVEFTRSEDQTIVLVKNTTYMNESGRAVQGFLSYFFKDKLVSQEKKDEFLSSVYLAYDDLDIQFGLFKIQLATHPKIHNGVNNVMNALGSDAFWNIRIGTDNRQTPEQQEMSGKDFVLHRLKTDERQVLVDVYEKIFTEVLRKK